MKLSLDRGRTERVLIGKADVLKNTGLPTFDKVQLTLTDLVKSLRITLDQALLLKLDHPLKRHSYSCTLLKR